MAYPSSRKKALNLETPDGGWGWIVLIGAVLIVLLVAPLGNCFGILFSRLFIRLEATTTTVAWIFNIFSFLWCIAGVFGGPLCEEFGWRTVASTGAILCSVCIISSAFSTTSTQLYFSFSLLAGIGGGLCTNVCFLILPYYFKRRGGIANAIMMACSSLGQIAVPPFARFLQDEYGFFGSTLILGGLLLNACVGAFLFHPLEWHAKPNLLDLIDPRLLRPAFSRILCESPRSSEDSTDVKDVQSGESPTPASRPLRGQRGSSRLASVDAINRHSLTSGSLVDISSICAVTSLEDFQALRPEEKDEKDFQEESFNSLFLVVKHVLKSTIENLKILSQMRALLYALGHALLLNGYINFLMMIPFAVLDEGYSLEEAAYFISTVGVTNTLARLVVSSVTDLPGINKKICYMGGLLLLSASSFGFTMASNFPLKMTAMALWGVGLGSSFGILNLIRIEMLGLENLGATIGSANLIIAIGMLVFGPLVGFVRDVTQSYRISMNCLAAIKLASFCLWLLMPWAVKADKRRESRRQQKEINDLT